MPSVVETLAINLAALIEKRKTNHTALAKSAGLAPNSVKNYLQAGAVSGSKGKERAPDLSKVEKLAQKLGVSVPMLLTPGMDPAASRSPPTLADALSAVGEALRAAPPSSREFLATNLAGWARDGGSDEWREAIERAMSRAQERPKEAA